MTRSSSRQIVTKCDYEAELGVVIGTTVRGVSKENAFEAVAGYVVANDVSARDLQFSDGQWTRGKSPDTFCPVGPLVPAAEVSDPHALGIRAILNGETMQDSTTANLIFGIDEVISYARRRRRSRPATSSSPGRRPASACSATRSGSSQPGDEITIEIDGVGSLTNPVRRRLTEGRPMIDSRRGPPPP